MNEFKVLAHPSLLGTRTAITCKYLSRPIYILIEIYNKHQASIWTKQCLHTCRNYRLFQLWNNRETGTTVMIPDYCLSATESITQHNTTQHPPPLPTLIYIHVWQTEVRELTRLSQQNIKPFNKCVLMLQIVTPAHMSFLHAAPPHTGQAICWCLEGRHRHRHTAHHMKNAQHH
jgi:hypothetical protein